MSPFRQKRGLRMESLERRQLFASDVAHNFLTPHDVNDDSKVTAMDALVVINHVNRNGSASVEDRPRFLDVNDDSRINPLDALQVINRLNRTSSSSSDGSTNDSTDEAIAVLFGANGLRAKAEYETESGSPKLEIKVQNGVANQNYQVLIGDVLLGTLATDNRGRGRLDFEPNDDSSQPLPTNIPSIAPGVSFAIEGLGESFFRALGSAGGDDNSSGNNSNGNSSTTGASELVARLSGANSLSGRAKLETTSSQSEFVVEIENAPANTTYSVEVDNVVIGSLTTDRRGRGKLAFESTDRSKPFPAGFPAIVAGSSVRIGSLTSGVFAKSSQDD